MRDTGNGNAASIAEPQLRTGPRSSDEADCAVRSIGAGLAQATSAEEHPQPESYEPPEKIKAVGMADIRTPQSPGRKLSECIGIAKG
jgi:hypothetical protein